MYRKTMCLSLLLILGVAGRSFSQVASGGSFVLTQTVIANGGGTSSGANFAADGTAGQAIAGTQSSSARFSVRGGFWQSFLLPTAAMVSVAGRVTTPDGRGIPDVRVTLIDAGSTARTCISNNFGYYHFDEIEVGRTYVISATSKEFTFAARAITVNDEIADFDLVGFSEF